MGADQLFDDACGYNKTEGHDTCFCKDPPVKKPPPPPPVCKLSKCTADSFSYSCATEKYTFEPKSVGGKTVSETTRYTNGRVVICRYDTKPMYCKDDLKAHCEVKGKAE